MLRSALSFALSFALLSLPGVVFAQVTVADVLAASAPALACYEPGTTTAGCTYADFDNGAQNTCRGYCDGSLGSCLPTSCCEATPLGSNGNAAQLVANTSVCAGPAGTIEPGAADTSLQGTPTDARADTSLSLRRAAVAAIATRLGEDFQSDDYCGDSFVPAYTCSAGAALNGQALLDGAVAGCGLGNDRAGATSCSPGSNCAAIPSCLTYETSSLASAFGPMGVCSMAGIACDPDNAAHTDPLNGSNPCGSGNVCRRGPANSGLCVPYGCNVPRVSGEADAPERDLGVSRSLRSLTKPELALYLDRFLQFNYGAVRAAAGSRTCSDITLDACRAADPAFWNLNKQADEFYDAWKAARPTDFVIVTDRSGSMSLRDSGPNPPAGSGSDTRIGRARDAIRSFSALVEKTLGHRVALVSFSHNSATPAQSASLDTGTTASPWVNIDASFDPDSGTFASGLIAQNVGGMTSIGSGLQLAKQLIDGRSSADQERPAAIILLTDGQQNATPCVTLRDGSTTSYCTNTTGAFTRGTRAQDIALDTAVCVVAIGSDTDVDEPMLRSIADQGAFFTTGEAKGQPGGSLAGALAKCVRELSDDVSTLDPRSYLPRARVALPPETYASCGDSQLRFSAEWGSVGVGSESDMRLLVNRPNGDLIVPSGSALDTRALNLRVLTEPNPENATYRMQVVRDTTRIVNGWAPDNYADADQARAVALVRRQIQRLCPDGCDEVLYYEDGATPSSPVASAYALALTAEENSGLLQYVERYTPAQSDSFAGAIGRQPWDLVVFAQKNNTGSSVLPYDGALSSLLCGSVTPAIVTDFRTGPATGLLHFCSGAINAFPTPPAGTSRYNYTELRDPDGQRTLIDSAVRLVARGRSRFSYPVAAFPYDEAAVVLGYEVYATLGATQLEVGTNAPFTAPLGETSLQAVFGATVSASQDQSFNASDSSSSTPRPRAAREITTLIHGKGYSEIEALELSNVGTTLRAGVRVLPWTRPAGGYVSVDASVSVTRPTEDLAAAIASSRGCEDDTAPNGDVLGGSGRTINQALIAKTTLPPAALNDQGVSGDKLPNNFVYQANLANVVQFGGTYDLDYTVRLTLRDVNGGTCVQTRTEHVTQYLGTFVPTSNVTCPAPDSLIDSVRPLPKITAANIGPVPVCGGNTANVELGASTDRGTLSGRVIAFAAIGSPAAFQSINGQEIASTNQQIVLPVGVTRIEWTAIDGGATTRVEQLVTVTQGNDHDGSCCPGGSIVTGNNWPNLLVRLFGSSYCMLGRGGNDTLQPGIPLLDGGADYLFGGSGADLLQCTGPNSRCYGGADNDQIYGFGAGSQLHGGAGHDTVFEMRDSSFWGGPGNDVAISLFGNNTVYPGSGFDLMTGGFGDDRFVIYDECELVAGEVIDGSFGNDTLVSPLTPAQLAARGVTVLSIENFVLDTEHNYLADCF